MADFIITLLLPFIIWFIILAGSGMVSPVATFLLIALIVWAVGRNNRKQV